MPKIYEYFQLDISTRN